jgi:hypothetical protein
MQDLKTVAPLVAQAQTTGLDLVTAALLVIKNDRGAP